MPTLDTISNVELIYKAFQEKPIRITYSTEKLLKQFKCTEEEVKQAKLLFKTYSKDYLIALTFGLQRRDLYDDYEEPIEGITYTVPANKLFDTLVGSKAYQKETEVFKEMVEKNHPLLYEEGWEVKQKWIKDKEGSKLLVKKDSDVDYKREFQDFVGKYTPKSFPIKSYKESRYKLAVVAMFDMHLGKIAFKHYTGNIDNLRYQEDYEEEFQKLLWFVKSQQPERILLPIGNDLFNVDNARLETLKGTKQSSTEDLHGVFNQGLGLMTMTIDALSTIAPVDVVLIPGNHAPTVETYLAIALKAIYDLNLNVTVDDRPIGRKYYSYGKNLIGLAHGELPLKKYAELLPYEAKEFFSNADHIEVLVGDKHVEEIHKTPIVDGDGLTVRRLAALTKTDLWHYNQGYSLSKRRSYVLVYDKQHGIELQYTNLAN
jgi:hypothetical protein